MREDIPISKPVRAGFMWNTDKEYMGELSYILEQEICTSELITIAIWDSVRIEIGFIRNMK